MIRTYILTLSIATSHCFQLLATISPKSSTRGYISTVVFPNLHLRDGLNLIHSPLQWASGAGLLFGVSPFEIVKCRGPFICGDRKMLHIDAFERESGRNMTVVFDSLTNLDSRITFWQCPHRHTVRFKLNLFAPQGVGFVFTVFTSSDQADTSDADEPNADEPEVMELSEPEDIESELPGPEELSYQVPYQAAHHLLPNTDRFPEPEKLLIRQTLLACLADNCTMTSPHSHPQLRRYCELVNPS
jgi:hypothetical protein